MQPTLRSIGLFALGAPFSIAAILLDDRLWGAGFVYLVIAMLLLAWDFFTAPAWQALGFDIDAPNAGFIGDGEDLTLKLSLPASRRQTIFEVLCDVNDLIEPVPVQHVIAVPGQTTSAVVRLLPRRRGQAVIERIWLRWSGPFQLVQRIQTVEIAHNFPVIPNVRAVHREAIRFFARDSLFGAKSEKQQGDGSEFSALREYVPGLDHRSIDWKHSARHRALVCKEFETERNHQIILAVDTGHLMSEPLGHITKLDHAINAALLIAYVSLRHGDRIGFFGFDAKVRHYLEPVTGIGGFRHLQRLSADLEYQPSETNFTLALASLMGRLNRRSLIIILTDFVDTTTAELMIESVGRLTTRHLVLFVSMRDSELHSLTEVSPSTPIDIAKAVVADDVLKERRLVFGKLRRLGVHCLEAPGTRVGPDLVNQYLAIKRDELI